MLLLENKVQDFQSENETFNDKNGDLLFISTAKDASKLSRSSIQNLVGAFRDAFGHGNPVDPAGWSEYARCSCGQRSSIEEVFKLDTYLHINDAEKIPKTNISCPSCSNQMELFYDPKNLELEFQQQFQQQSYISCMQNSDNEIVGFSLASITTPKKIWADKLTQFFDSNSFNYERFVSSIRNLGIGECDEILYYAETGIILPKRNFNGYFWMINKMLKDIQSKNLSQRKDISMLPVLAAIAPEANSYKVFAGIGCEVVPESKNEELVLLYDNFQSFYKKFDTNPREFQKNLFAGMRRLIQLDKDERMN